MSTPNMSLVLPGPLVTLGPTWAQLLNDALDVVDAHDHTAGNGVPIPSAALNINDDIDFAGYALDNLGRASLVNLGAAETTPRALYSFGGELYYTDASGNAVQLTIGGTAAGGGGSIDGLVSPASAYYNSGAQTFEWSVNATLRADLDFGRALFRQNNAASGPAITLGAPTTGVSAYTVTLPPAAPTGGTTRLVSAPAGSTAALAWISTDGSSIEISGSTLQVKALGITTAKIADLAVTTAKIADGNVTTAKILDGNVTTTKILDGNVTTAKILDSNVTTAKIANGNVTTAKIATGNVTGGISGVTPTGSIAYRTIDTENLVEASITTAKILDLNVTTGKLANISVTTAKIADAAVTTAKLESVSVTTAKIATGAVTNAKIGTGAVWTGNLDDLAVTTAKINDLAVTEGKLANLSVATAKIAALAVSEAKIASGAVTTSKLGANAVTMGKRSSAYAAARSGTGTYTGSSYTVLADTSTSPVVIDGEGVLHISAMPAYDGTETSFYLIGESGQNAFARVKVELYKTSPSLTLVQSWTWIATSASSEAEPRNVPIQLPTFYAYAPEANSYYVKLSVNLTKSGGTASSVSYANVGVALYY